MAKNKDDKTETTELATATTQAATPPAERKAPRFTATHKQTKEKRTTDSPIRAHAWQQQGFEVIDALSGGKEYTGRKPE